MHHAHDHQSPASSSAASSLRLGLFNRALNALHDISRIGQTAYKLATTSFLSLPLLWAGAASRSHLQCTRRSLCITTSNGINVRCNNFDFHLTTDSLLRSSTTYIIRTCLAQHPSMGETSREQWFNASSKLTSVLTDHPTVNKLSSLTLQKGP